MSQTQSLFDGAFGRVKELLGGKTLLEEYITRARFCKFMGSCFLLPVCRYVMIFIQLPAPVHMFSLPCPLCYGRDDLSGAISHSN